MAQYWKTVYLTSPELTIAAPSIWDSALIVDSASSGSSGDVIYYGYAPPGSSTTGASWAIKQSFISTVGQLTNVTSRWASGSSAANQVWNSRASLAYS